jgi:hypothetical protein
MPHRDTDLIGRLDGNLPFRNLSLQRPSMLVNGRYLNVRSFYIY